MVCPADGLGSPVPRVSSADACVVGSVDQYVGIPQLGGFGLSGVGDSGDVLDRPEYTRSGWFLPQRGESATGCGYPGGLKHTFVDVVLEEVPDLVIEQVGRPWHHRVEAAN